MRQVGGRALSRSRHRSHRVPRVCQCWCCRCCRCCRCWGVRILVLDSSFSRDEFLPWICQHCRGRRDTRPPHRRGGIYLVYIYHFITPQLSTSGRLAIVYLYLYWPFRGLQPRLQSRPGPPAHPPETTLSLICDLARAQPTPSHIS